MNQITPCSMPTIQEKRPTTEIRMISNIPYLFIQRSAKVFSAQDIDEEIFHLQVPDTTFFLTLAVISQVFLRLTGN
ncbi:hypothetical protein HHL23_05670 [Chryseobacterium sp. RP-3-3]|uniref:Uncharacterized protein n=1 Tax=Chryseobacterium antibioticum TaxID=2728847 RepID=A0A7Y0AL37_9FLAO|nr:hypothetical protein [Chryseobacterium antibioticum]NML69281.1 hypothetical protein [Chryseobacterium antibioticum]